MDLINISPAPAALGLLGDPLGDQRTAVVTAKLTFRFTDAGLVLDRDDPIPLFDADHETELGLLPRDDLPRLDGGFEVIALGRAHAPNGQPASSVKVQLTVGTVKRLLRVSGDRVWQGEGPQARISDAVPFTTMPLTWEHAFGGRTTALIDADSPVDLMHPLNPPGKGFDAAAMAREFCRAIAAPDGFPSVEGQRRLPNIEDPDTLIIDWSDMPEPAGWATLPLESGMAAHRPIVAEVFARYGDGLMDHVTDAVADLRPHMMLRAHPAWVIDPPPAGAVVELIGMTQGGRLAAPLPAWRVLADLAIGEAERPVELLPVTLVLLPEEERCYLVYRGAFTFVPHPGEERTARLRLAEGWVHGA